MGRIPGLTVESINFIDPELMVKMKQEQMLEKKNYANGQKVYELNDNKLTYFFKTGKIRATGPYINERMERKWLFYRETGQLWVVGNFNNNMKNGSWIRYDINDRIEYQELFENNRLVRQK
jgi:antitoxin component YwqK of YwqJK toxin-antitoxin module